MTTRNRTFLTLAVVAMACFAMITSAQAGLVGQLGVLDEAWFVTNPNNPDGNPWQAGDTYQLAFTTTTKTVGNLSTNIAAYDAIVQADAVAGGVGSVTWKALGSTKTVAANAHAVVSGPVYNFATDLIAPDYADFWDTRDQGDGFGHSNIISHIDGTDPSGLTWTGSDYNGNISTYYGMWLGGDGHASKGMMGQASLTPAKVFDQREQGYGFQGFVYGLSPELTVASTGGGDPVIPEPSTFLIWTLGLLGLIGFGRRRKR